MNILANLLSGAGAAGTAGGDITGSGGGDSIWNNKLFLQYLNAAGQDILAGEPIGKNVGAATSQNIQSQNFAKMLSKMLGGGGKVSFDKDGLSLKAPTEAINKVFPELDTSKGVFGSGSMLGEYKAVPEPGVGTPRPTSGRGNLSAFGLTPSQLGNINPFVGSQSGITASDLAGLTTADLGNIVGLGLKSEELGRKSAHDIIDSMYKLARTRKAEAEISKLDKEEKTTAMKNYEYARAQGYKGSFEQWDKDIRTTHQKDYEEAVKSGYKGSFQAWLERMATLGGVKLSLNTKLAEKEAMGSLENQQFVQKPDFHQKVLNDLEKTDDYKFPPEKDVKSTMAKYNVTRAQAEEAVRKWMHRNEMDKQIKQAYPKAVWKQGKGWVVDGKIVVRDPYVR